MARQDRHAIAWRVDRAVVLLTNPIAPVLRSLSFVHDGNDQHVITAHLVDHAVRKATKRALAEIIDEDGRRSGAVAIWKSARFNASWKRAANLGYVALGLVPAPDGFRLVRGRGVPSELNHLQR